MKIITALLLFLTIAFFTSCDTKKESNDTYLLKMRLDKGDKFANNVTMNMEMMVVKMTMISGAEFEVLDSTAAGKELKMTYTRMEIKSGMPGVSQALADSAVARSSRQLIGRSIIIVLAGNKVVDVKGLEALKDSSGSETARSLEKMFSKETINSMFGIMFNMYPGKPVKIGDSWTQVNSIDMSGMKMDLDIKNKFTLLNVKDGVAEIGVDGELDSEAAIPRKDTSMNEKINMDMKGTQKGKMYVTLSDGYLKNGQYDIDIDAKVSVQGREMPMKMKVTCTMSGGK